jgi:hypothetical protein
LYWFAALLTKWTGFMEHDPIASGRLYTLFTIWLLPEVFALTFRRPWGLWPAVVFVAVGGASGLAGSLAGGGVWNPVLAGWTYAGDLLVWGAVADLFPVAILTRSPGCELGALPWLLAGRQGGPRPGQPVPWVWTASTRGRPYGEGEWRTLLPPDMGDRWRHRPVSSLLGWWLMSLVRSITTEVFVRWRRS